MGVLTARTLFVPYKLVLSEKRPVTLEIDVENRGGEKVLASIVLTVPKELALNPSGFAKREERRIGELRPGERKKLRFLIYAKPTTLPGQYKLLLELVEHQDSYDYVVRVKRKELVLRAV